MDSDRDPSENPLSDDEEEFGGPVKPFLEHLEDLRWVLIRVALSVGIGMLICLIASNQIAKVLSWPLDRANILLEKLFESKAPEGGGMAYLEFGTNVWRYSLESEQFDGLKALSGDTNETQQVAFRVEPVTVGTNTVLAIAPAPIPDTTLFSPKGQLINLGPFEGFKVAFQVALYGGIALSLPFILLFLGHFIMPAPEGLGKTPSLPSNRSGRGIILHWCALLLLRAIAGRSDGSRAVFELAWLRGRSVAGRRLYRNRL